MTELCMFEARTVGRTRGDDQVLGVAGILRLPGTFAVTRGPGRQERAQPIQNCTAASEIAGGSASQSPPRRPSQAEALST